MSRNVRCVHITSSYVYYKAKGLRNIKFKLHFLPTPVRGLLRGTQRMKAPKTHEYLILRVKRNLKISLNIGILDTVRINVFAINLKKF